MSKLNTRKISNEEIDQESSDSSKNENAPSISGSDLCTSIVSLSLNQKSLDTVAYNVSKVSSIADYIVIASGTSKRHVKGICDKIKDGCNNLGASVLRVEGYESGEWVIIDYGDVIAHIFYEPTRQHFKFDSLFEDSEKIEFNEELQNKARKFKTGLHSI